MTTKNTEFATLFRCYIEFYLEEFKDTTSHLGLDGSDGVPHRHRVRPALLQETDVQLQLRILQVMRIQLG